MTIKYWAFKWVKSIIIPQTIHITEQQKDTLNWPNNLTSMKTTKTIDDCIENIKQLRFDTIIDQKSTELTF